VVALCGQGAHERGAELALRIINLADPEGQSVLRLVLEEDLPGWDGETWPALAVVGEGRLIATWHAADREELLAEALVELALDNLLTNGADPAAAVPQQEFNA
jgi:hypothetical protein